MGKRIELTQVYRRPAKARSSAAEPSAHNGLVASSTLAAPTKSARKAKKPKPTKSKTSPSRKIYLAAKAKERRAAVKAGLSLKITVYSRELPRNAQCI